ncbi:MAG: ATP-binding protein [Gorillibacterium sp.]|nr:ATP-binding protein [Gorillibacterium sp.]
MDAVQKEVTLYGLGDHQSCIDEIIEELDLGAHAFEVKLILMEAVINAYHHGNLGDCTKPIHIRYLLKDKQLHLQVEDCGGGGGKVSIPEKLDDANLLEEGGRGLYLIRCFSDRVEMIQNALHISKCLNEA